MAELRVISTKVSLSQRIRDIWRFRELLVGLTKKELKVKYKESILGFVWSMLNPALYLAVFYVVFQLILKAAIPQFPVFLLSGLLVWNLFSTGVSFACVSVVSNSGLIKKVSFPREILSFASVGAATVHFFLQTIVLLLAMAILRHAPAPHYLILLPLALVALIVFTSAVGILLAAINVYLRDTQHLLELALLAWFWACPIVYAYQTNIATRQRGLGHYVVNHWAWLYRLNPVVPIILTFQRALYNRTALTAGILPPDGAKWYGFQLLLVLVFSLGLLLVAMKVFSRLEGNFAEEL
jgi:ABC-2 type transport system permease protein